MRLDKFIGKAGYDQKFYIYDWYSNKTLFVITDGENYSDLREDLKKYKIRYYHVCNSDKSLFVFVKERKDD